MRDYRRENLATRYGITIQQFEDQLNAQGGKCACCGKTLLIGTEYHRHPDHAVVDHSHDSGANRGILCNACNTSIGGLGDELEGIMRAASYLANPPWSPHKQLELFPV